MKRALPALLLVVAACVAQPPERAELPRVADVIQAPTGCQLSVGRSVGIIVEDVIEGTAADGAVEPDDLIVAVDGVPTPDVAALRDHMITKSVGDPLMITIDRDSDTLDRTITLGANPSDQSSPQIGVLIRTHFETIPAGEAGAVVSPSQTARPIGLGGELFIFDPVSGAWQSTSIELGENLNWVATRSGFYTLDIDTLDVIDLSTGGSVDNDGFQQWDPLRLIGSLGQSILMVVTTDVPDQPGFVIWAIASFNPVDGTTSWATPMLAGFGAPVVAYPSHDASRFVVVGVDQDTGAVSGTALVDSAGTLQTSVDLSGLGTPVGWFDNESVAFRSSEDVISIHNLADGETVTHTVSTALVEAPMIAAGDGTHMIGINGRDLVYEDIAGAGDTVMLAENCSIGRIGEPGWGL